MGQHDFAARAIARAATPDVHGVAPDSLAFRMHRLTTRSRIVNAASLWPLLGYAAAVLLLVTVMLGLSWVLGQRHREPATGEPYEGGIVSTGSAHMRLSVQFYLVAMFFVIFDLEAVFLFAWAVAVRELGWAGLVEAAIFVVVLLAALVYLWRLGALDWSALRRRTVARGGPTRAGVSMERAA